jgi:hypothetical protein
MFMRKQHHMKFNSYVNHCRGVQVLGAAVILGLSLCRVEAVQLVISEAGDFSDDLGSPSQISPVLEPGTNIIQGSVDGNTFVMDHDYFRVALPSGSRLTGLTLRITSWVSPEDYYGFFDILPENEGNSGDVTIAGNTTETISPVIGNPNNIILHTEAPFAGLGQESSYNYELELLVAPVEAVSGTAIHKAVEITFPSVAGQYYQLQCTSDLNSAAWSNIGNRMVGVDGTMSAFDTTRNANQRFYRVIKQ